MNTEVSISNKDKVKAISEFKLLPWSAQQIVWTELEQQCKCGYKAYGHTVKQPPAERINLPVEWNKGGGARSRRSNQRQQNQSTNQEAEIAHRYDHKTYKLI